MSLLKRLFTAARGGATEVGEAIADTQAIRILDQEIRDANEAIRSARVAQTAITAKRKLKQQEVSDLQKDLDKYLGITKGLLDKGGQEDLLNETADHVAALEARLSTETVVLEQLVSNETAIATTLKNITAKLEQTKQQVDNVKATEAVQRAQSSVASQRAGVNSALGSAAASLSRIQEKQRQRKAMFEAAEDLDAQESGSSLDAKLAAAGIGSTSSSGSDVLARLRAEAAK